MNVVSKRWTATYLPRKILVIRYQATGDLVITLPYLNSFKKLHPDSELHLLTRKEIVSIPKSLTLFKKVVSVGGGRNVKLQFLHTLLLLPYLWWQRYDVVVDLQNHRMSQFVRRWLKPNAWSEFDKFAPLSAGERTRHALDAIQLKPVVMDTAIVQEIDIGRLKQKMAAAGWMGKDFVILNPAGAFRTRRWPIDNYVAFARLWQRKHPEVQFLITGLSTKIAHETTYLKARLGNDLISMVDNTTAAEAFGLVKMASLVLTEDGGLMHMAWVQAVPTVALFGSSRSDWSTPLGEWSLCLNSSDLPCGNCLLEECTYGDVHCLTRYTPEFVAEQAQLLWHRNDKGSQQ